jgi:integrase
MRDIELTLALQAEPREHLAHMAALGRATTDAAPIFPTYRGGQHSASNVRSRLLAECGERANARREAAGRMPLPDKVTPHTLRRTSRALRSPAGRDPRWVMAQLGHTDARLTLNVYARVMQRQRVDEDLIRQLMRFPDEPEERTFGPTKARKGFASSEANRR